MRSRRNETRARRACAAMFSDAGQGGPETIGECIRAVATTRGRNIVVIPRSLAETEIFGIWFALDDYDLILVDEDASRAHRSHIVGHELGHIVLGHDMIPDDSALLPDVPALCRKSLASPKEQEAELFASILQSELHKRQSRCYRRLQSPAAQRIASSLDRPQ